MLLLAWSSFGRFRENQETVRITPRLLLAGLVIREKNTDEEMFRITPHLSS